MPGAPAKDMPRSKDRGFLLRGGPAASACAGWSVVVRPSGTARYRRHGAAANFARIRGMGRSDWFRAHLPSSVLTPVAHAGRAASCRSRCVHGWSVIVRPSGTARFLTLHKNMPPVERSGVLFCTGTDGPGGSGPCRERYFLIIESESTQRTQLRGGGFAQSSPENSSWVRRLEVRSKKERSGLRFQKCKEPSGTQWCDDDTPANARLRLSFFLRAERTKKTASEEAVFWLSVRITAAQRSA